MTPCQMEILRLLHRSHGSDTNAGRAIQAAIDEIGRLRHEVEHADDCTSCNGMGHRWYSLYGDVSCLLCKGTGKRS